LTQGTISVIIGCHSPIHSLLVGLAWRRLYGVWPSPWEWACIIVHDLGHLGRNYLDNYEEKKGHWELGARIAGILFGREGYLLVAGHSEHSGEPESRMFRADKFSWSLAPTWWLWLHTYTEPKILCRPTRREHVRWFREQVAKSIGNGEWKETHKIWLDRNEREGQ
jgi:hypothetical protein